MKKLKVNHPKSNLTQDFVKSVFNYDSGGFLIWKIQKSNLVNIGEIAGGFSKSLNRNVISLNNEKYLSARVIFLWHHGYMPPVVDHEDRNKLNDKIENLRPATRSQNNKNSSSRKNSSSKFLGVYYNKRSGKWNTKLQCNGKKVFWSSYGSETEAAVAYNGAAKIHFGEFANLNIF